MSEENANSNPGGNSESDGGVGGSENQNSEQQNSQSQNDNSSAGNQTDKDKELESLRNFKNTLLGEKKKEKERADKLEQELQQIKEKQLSEQGNFKELNEQLKEKHNKLLTDHQKMVGSFGYRCIKAEIQAEAAKMGCIDSDGLMAFVNDKIDQIDIDEDFNVSKTNVKEVLEDIKSVKTYLFNKKGQTIHDNPPGKPQTGTKDWKKKLSLEEKVRLLASGKYQQE